MRELHGVSSIFLGDDFPHLKFNSFVIDKFYLIDTHAEVAWSRRSTVLEAEVEFLRGRGLLLDIPAEVQSLTKAQVASNRLIANFPHNALSDLISDENNAVAEIASAMQTSSKPEVIPIFRHVFAGTKRDSKMGEALTAAFKLMPDAESAAWEDILGFKAEASDKLWGFRRFLHTLATKKQTEAELRDDLEWSLNEYKKAMKVHKLKTGNSFAEVYVIPAIEVIEDIAKFNWSKIAKGALSVRKRQVELMETEMKAPGREVAYIYDAQKRFG